MLGCQFDLRDEEGTTAKDGIQDNNVQLMYELAIQPWHPGTTKYVTILTFVVETQIFCRKCIFVSK